MFISHFTLRTKYANFFQRKSLRQLSEAFKIIKTRYSIDHFKSTFSKPFVDADIISMSSSQSCKVPNGIKMDKNGKIILEGQNLCSLKSDALEALLKKFNLQGLQPKFLDKYGVIVSRDGNRIFFPLFDVHGKLTAVQFLDDNGNMEILSQDVLPNGGEVALFGWPHASTCPHRDVVVTSHPADAVAVNQETDLPVLSIPFSSNSISSQLFSILGKFQKVILWLQKEHQNWRTHMLFAENLGKKAFFIRPQIFTTPTLSIQHGIDFKRILMESWPLKHDSMETFSTFRKAVKDEFCNREKYSGLKWKRYHVLNGLLKGHRSGELTILSGQTGTGKTTFISEYSLDLCMQGLPTLWGSFEITNTRLIKTMLTQFALCSLPDNKEKFPHFASEFEQLPMFFLNFNGDHTLRHVLEVMLHAVIAYSIKHVVIDNLQFMMNSEEFNSIMDLLRRQDQIFGAFRQFATRHNCHVTLVMHPRKEPEFTELNNTSISGSAKAIQEADNILLLQTTKTRQYLQVTKNRFDGEKGCVLLEFNKSNLTFDVKKIYNNFKDTS